MNSAVQLCSTSWACMWICGFGCGLMEAFGCVVGTRVKIVYGLSRALREGKGPAVQPPPVSEEQQKRRFERGGTMDPGTVGWRERETKVWFV